MSCILTFKRCAVIRTYTDRVEVVVDPLEAESVAKSVLTGKQPEPLTRHATAKRLGVSVRTLSRHMTSGRIQYRKIGRRAEFLPEWIEAFRARGVISSDRLEEP